MFGIYQVHIDQIIQLTDNAEIHKSQAECAENPEE
jgi:hypothetical protein